MAPHPLVLLIKIERAPANDIETVSWITRLKHSFPGLHLVEGALLEEKGGCIHGKSAKQRTGCYLFLRHALGELIEAYSLH